MSKRPNQPGPPKRVPSTPVPLNARKEPAPIQPGPAVSGNSTPKFYNGPTVSKNSAIPDYSKDVAKKTVQSAKVQTKKAVAVARRHPWSIASLITTIPFIVFISLFSTVVCPPPSTKTPSTISKYVLSPLGLTHPPQSGSLHQTLCYPANAYHDAVLEPYIYPLVDQAQHNLVNHPVYVKGVEPTYTRVRDTTTKVWNGPVRPVVRRIQREIKRAYLTFVQPHIPYIRTKFHTLTAPYTGRIAALHKQYLHPQLAAAQLYANSAKDQSIKSYNYISTHPVTGHAGRYANLGYQVGRKRSIEAYKWSKPHVIKAAKEAERITREILGPRVIKGLEIGGEHVARGYKIVKSRVVALYYAHLDPHVGPHIKRATTVLAPHVETFNQKVYRPYIRPSLEAMLPSFVFTPQPPRTFWAMISDFLPSVGQGAAERKGRMDDGYSRVRSDVKTKTASVRSKISASSSSVSRSASVTASPSPTATKKDSKGNMTRSEMDKTRENLRKRIEEQGKKGYKQVKSELVALHRDILNTKFAMLQQGSRAELEQDINYVVTGLDKLYSKSPVLKKDQVTKSSQQADAKLQSKVSKIKSKIDGLKKDWHDQGRPIVQKAFRPLDQLSAEKDVLADEMAWVDDVNPKDWTKFNQLQPAIDGWKEKYMGLHNGQVKDKALLEPSANIDKNLADLYTEIEDIVEGFRARVGILKRTAMDRVEAREVLAAESSSSSSASSSVSASKSPVAAAASSETYSILPIAERAAEAIGAAGIIGKGKQQVIDALNQANEAVAGSVAPTGHVQQARSAASDLVSSASSVIHDATRSVVSAAGGTPSPEGVSEHAQSVVNVASKSIASVASSVSAAMPDTGAEAYLEAIASQVQQGAAAAYAQAQDGIHQASKSIVSAAGGTPAPEGAAEYAASVADQARSSASSIGSVVSSAVHQATRSVIAAGGGTPVPEGIADYASVASASASSIVAGATQAIGSVVGDLPASASSVGSVVSQAVHDGTRSVVSAVGGTPSPESVGEHVESVYNQASASASSIGDVIASAVHDGTRSASSVLGASPTPESVGEHANSIKDKVASAGEEIVSSASSVVSSLSGEIHTATRSLAKSVGATAAPEGLGEKVEDILRRVGEVEEGLEERLRKAVGRDEL